MEVRPECRSASSLEQMVEEPLRREVIGLASGVESPPELELAHEHAAGSLIHLHQHGCAGLLHPEEAAATPGQRPLEGAVRHDPRVAVPAAQVLALEGPWRLDTARPVGA